MQIVAVLIARVTLMGVDMTITMDVGLTAAAILMGAVSIAHVKLTVVVLIARVILMGVEQTAAVTQMDVEQTASVT